LSEHEGARQRAIRAVADFDVEPAGVRSLTAWQAHGVTAVVAGGGPSDQLAAADLAVDDVRIVDADQAHFHSRSHRDDVVGNEGLDARHSRLRKAHQPGARSGNLAVGHRHLAADLRSRAAADDHGRPAPATGHNGQADGGDQQGTNAAPMDCAHERRLHGCRIIARRGARSSR
jgi:hypothetical protein